MIEYRVGDVFDRLGEIPDGSIDLLVTSPPFLALRSYLPADHPDKGKEIGSEATPAAFLDTLLALTAEWGRILAPHGSICVELGDTYAAGGDVMGMRVTRQGRPRPKSNGDKTDKPKRSAGWPLAKSLTGIPTLYTWSLAYGRNLLTGEPSPAGQWRIRNVIVWARPNPPVGALGDKFRPATSYITVACRGPRRYFDLDAVRTPFSEHTIESAGRGAAQRQDRIAGGARPYVSQNAITHAGAPPLDWHADDHPEDGDWLWKLSTQPYRGSHYATFPLELPRRLILAMCPQRVCEVCGKPSERITGDVQYVRNGERCEPDAANFTGLQGRRNSTGHSVAVAPTLGWSDCDCLCYSCGNGGCPVCLHKWRTGIVLDPFAGSGTTLEAAQAVGRHAIGIDLDERNADLARDRVGMFLTVEGAA